MNNDNQYEPCDDAYVDGLAAKMRRARWRQEALRVAKRGLRIVENVIGFALIGIVIVSLWLSIISFMKWFFQWIN